MKRMMTTLFALATILGAMAQWGNQPGESVVLYDGDISVLEMKMAPNGNTWVYYQIPADENYSNLSVHLQLLDTAGNKLLGEHGLMISDKPTRTWTTCNEYLFVDRDGNAVVAVHDVRNAIEEEYLSYSLYKISQTGDFLWGEDGINLEGTQSFPLSSHMTMTQVDDGSYVCTWSSANEDLVVNTIKAQRISPDGEMLWNIDEVEIIDRTGKVNYDWPTVVDAGYNQVIIIYYVGSNRDIYARKLDFDGTPVWSEDTRLYRSGWTQVPAWSVTEVSPSGDGGAIVTWTDDRYLTGTNTYITYVQPNGEIGFAAGVDGQKLGYSNYLGSQSHCLYDPYTDSFLAVWRESFSSKAFRIMAQRLSKDGELLWGENGYEVQPFSESDYGYFTIQNGANGEAAIFYMNNESAFTSTHALATIINTTDTTQRRDVLFTDNTISTEKSTLLSTAMYNDSFWTVAWVDDYLSNPSLHTQRINNDLTLGAPKDAAIEAVEAENTQFAAVISIVEGDALFVANMPAPTQAVMTVRNMNGAIVATPYQGELAAGRQYIEWSTNVPAGIYLATLETAFGAETVKVIVK